MHQGAFTLRPANKLIFSHMTMIDNVGGFSGGIGGPKLGEHHDYVIEFNDNKVYGESAADDCPADGSYCKKFDKTGFINGLFI
jgi:hypothetical protein